jgi:hypothetical protein
MRPMNKASLAAAAVLIFGAGAMAQGVARHGVVISRPAPARPIVRPVRQPVIPITTGRSSFGGTTFINNSGGIFTRTAVPLNAFGNGVPGLGFDYPHLAAVSGADLGVKALIDPATQADIALAERLSQFAQPVTGFLPVFDSGIPVVTQAPAQQPPVIIVQQPAPVAAPAEQPAPAATPAVTPAPQAPVPDIGTFILVKKDGTQIKAGAYFRQGNQVIYITPAGARRTMLYSELNLDATRQVNAEHGTTVDF